MLKFKLFYGRFEVYIYMAKVFLIFCMIKVYKKCAFWVNRIFFKGGEPKSLPVFDQEGDDVKGQVLLFRSVKDFKRLYDIVESGKHVTIVGGGFLGSELACALGYKSKFWALKKS